MSKSERSPKPEIRNIQLRAMLFVGLRFADFIRHSSFVIQIS